jgi:hypothetical protein
MVFMTHRARGGGGGGGVGMPVLSRLHSNILIEFYSVADPGCLYRIPDPDFCPPDPGSRTATKERGEKNLLSYLF